ncbi:hypothetical protein NNC19_19165 [Clostridium sp. SHJSY1]|uniref:hypothetical protein n=1 Tax=Clostridium sp. SHJSY1 TaxID=2942483 RepID=UPI0028745DB1|nr:hypothetical protein [Clostridium sp. SHJSY1]MDS0527816.1 hypothetical protein [Clostridium sp. SHJSY1]
MKKQKVNKLKKVKLINFFTIILITMFTISCSSTKEQVNEKKVSNVDTSTSSKVNEKTVSNTDTSVPSEVKKENLVSIFGTIKNIDKGTKIVDFDDLEIVTADQKERMKEIGITDRDFSNWYMYNQSNEIKSYKIKDNVSITIYNKDTNGKISTDINGLYNQVKSGYENYYNIKLQGEYIVEIVQKIMNE